MIALTTVSFVNAQITTNAGTFNKPTAGDVAFETKFTPNLQGTSMFKESNSGTLMMRTFKSDTKAIRISGDLLLDTTPSDTNWEASVGYGVENHFAGAERLSTYWGYEGKLGYKSSSEDFTIGAAAFLGADYYIVPKVYIGTEMGYGFTDIANFKLDNTITANLRLGFRL